MDLVFPFVFLECEKLHKEKIIMLKRDNMNELRQLTGQNIKFIGPRARENLKRALIMARKKACQNNELRAPSNIGHVDGALLHFAMEWAEITWQAVEHANCENMQIQCIGCNMQVCVHLSEYVCSFLPVCKWCDTHVQPNPFNPINRLTHLPVCDITSRLCNEIDKNNRLTRHLF